MAHHLDESMKGSMKNFEYTIETKKNFDEAVAAVEEKSAQKGFRVLHTHDVAIAEFFPNKGIDAVASEVQKAVLEIVNSAAA